MRIIHIAEALGGGIFEIVNNLSVGLVDRDHEVAIAYGVRPETPTNLRGSVDPRITLIPTPWTARTLKASLHASRTMRPIVRGWKPDIIHLHSSFAGFTGAATLRGLAPTIYTPNGYSFTMTASRPRRVAFKMLERLVARRVSLVGAVSEAEARLAEEIGAPRVRIVMNGIPELDPGRIPGAATDQHPSVVAMGRVAPQRRPEQVAEILAAVSDLAPVSWLGGGRRLNAPGMHELARAGVPVTGWLTRDDALERLTRATVYLHWTAWDGLPLSILEAMAHDVVVIASDIPPNRGILGPRQVFSSTTAAIAALRRVLTDDGYRDEMLAEQRRRRSRFGAQAMTLGWERLYTDLLDARTG